MIDAEDRLKEARKRRDTVRERATALKDRIGELQVRKATVIEEACGDLDEVEHEIGEINAELRAALTDLEDLEAALQACERVVLGAETDLEKAKAADARQRAGLTVASLLAVSAKADAALADLTKALAERRELGRSLRATLPRDDAEYDLSNRIELRSVVSAVLSQAGLGEFAEIPRWDGMVALGVGFETHDRTILGGLVPPETNFRVRARGFGRWYVFDAAGEKLAGPFMDKAEAEEQAAKLWAARPPEPPKPEAEPTPSPEDVPPANPGRPGFGIAPAGFGRFYVVDAGGNNVAGPYRSEATALQAAREIAAATAMQ